MNDINNVLQNLNSNYANIIANISFPFYFSDEICGEGGFTFNYICDGNEDIFDTGNFLNTDLTQLYDDIKDDNVDGTLAIPYTHTQAAEEGNGDYTNPPMNGLVENGTDYFGTGSQYFTNMYPDLFVMGATGISISEFSVCGDIGADGGGEVEALSFQLTRNGTWTVFYKGVYNSNDPSYHHFIFVPGNGEGITHLYDTSTEYDDDCLQGLEGIKEIYFISLCKGDGSNSPYMSEFERIAVAQSFLDAIYSAQMKYPLPKIKFRVKTYDPATFVSTLPPDSNVDNLINQLLNQTVWIPGWPYPLKHDDEFTLYGKAAIDLRNKLPQLNSGGSVLEIVTEPQGIFILINDNFVDYVVNPGSSSSHEANNLIIYMNSVGITHSTFEDISAASWKSVSRLAKFILIPELERDDLLPSLSSSARLAIHDYVYNGGNLVMFCPGNGDVINVLNNIFGFNMSESGVSEPISLTSIGSSLYDGLSPTVPNNSDTDSINTTTLPINSKTLYLGDGSNQSVSVQISFGEGKIYVLGWDWYGAAPQGGEDGGWNDLLQAILTQ